MNDAQPTLDGPVDTPQDIALFPLLAHAQRARRTFTVVLPFG